MRNVLISLCVSIILLVSYQGKTKPPMQELLLTTRNSPQRTRAEAKTADTDEEELGKVLREASMKEKGKTVIITVVNGAWMEEKGLVDLFMESFMVGEGTQDLLEHLLMVCVDKRAFNRCKRIHNHCFYLQTPGVDLSAEKYFMTEDFVKMMRRRILFLKEVADRGYNFIFSDADVLWLRNPLQRISGKADMQISCDRCDYSKEDMRNKPNTGFYMVRSNEKTRRLLSVWHSFALRYPSANDQTVFDRMKVTRNFSEIGLDLEFLEMRYFAGFCDNRARLEEVCTMHSNCCKGLRAKLSDLNAALHDWLRFKTLSRLPKASASPPLRWSSPDKCRRSMRRHNWLFGLSSYRR